MKKSAIITGRSNCLGAFKDVDRMTAFCDEHGFNPVFGGQAGYDTCIQEIKARIDSVSFDAKAGDWLLFYFAGHNVRAPELHETDKFGGVFDFSGFVVPDHDFVKWFNGFPEGFNIVIMLDTCYAEEVIEDFDLATKIDGIFDKDSIDANIYVMSASRETEIAFGNVNGGVFTNKWLSVYRHGMTIIDMERELSTDKNHHVIWSNNWKMWDYKMFDDNEPDVKIAAVTNNDVDIKQKNKEKEDMHGETSEKPIFIERTHHFLKACNGLSIDDHRSNMTLRQFKTYLASEAAIAGFHIDFTGDQGTPRAETDIPNVTILKWEFLLHLDNGFKKLVNLANINTDNVADEIKLICKNIGYPNAVVMKIARSSG